MNYPNNLKSPRASMMNLTVNNQISDLSNLQQSLLQKDQLISSLQGTINKLELKNKQYSSYQQAMLEYESRAEQTSNELLKVNQKLRAKNAECDQLKKKLDQQYKQKKQRTSSYVRQQDYAKLSNQFKKFKQTHRTCQNAIKQQKNRTQQVKGHVTGLQQQINSLLNVIKDKDTQINDLKVQKYNIKSNNSIPSQNDINQRSSTNIISSFRVIGQEGQNYTGQDQLVAYSRENDELRKKCYKLEQQIQNFLHSSQEWSTQAKNQQYAKIIQQYENNLSAMTKKLANIHKLQMEKNTLQQDRRKFEIQCEQLRQQLTSRISYCDNLQKKIRQIEHYKGASLQTDISNFVLRNQKLQSQVQTLQKILKQKHQQIIQLKRKFQSLEIAQQTYYLIQQNLNSLQQNLTQTKNQLRKQQQKAMQKQQQLFKAQRQSKRLQFELTQVKSQMAKTNRVVSQKVQKIQFQSVQIKRLEKQNVQKKQISEKLAKLEQQYKKLEKLHQQQIDESNQLAMTVIVLSAQVQRKVATGSMNKQFITQFQALKQKSRQTQINSKHLQERVKRLEHLHKQVVQQSIKISQHLHASHKRWNHYDTAMDSLLNFLQETQQRNKLKYEQLDSNINTWLTLQQQRLKELAKTDSLAQECQYVKYTAKITTQPVVLSNQLKNL